jgi:hypothetical protein
MRKQTGVIAVALAMTVATLATITGSAGAASSPVAVPTSGAYFGASALRPGETRMAGIERTESQIGRMLAIDHQFYRWNQAIPTSQEAADISAGRIPFVSWMAKRTDGTAVSWTSINSGAEDAWIASRADAVKAFGKPLFMVFHPEPYNESLEGWGSPADFVAAWRHVISIFRNRGVDNVSWVQVMTSWDYQVTGRMDQWYVGDDWTDWLAADPYNFFTRDKKWVSLQQATMPFYTWGSARAKPLMLAEWGTEEDPATPGRKAQWFTDAAAWLKTAPNIKAVVYFNNLADGYDWQIDTSTSSLSSFAAMANDSWFSPVATGAQPAAATTTTTLAPTTTVAPTTTTLAPTTTVAPTTTLAPTTTVAPTATTAVVVGSWSGTLAPKSTSTYGVRVGASLLTIDYRGNAGATVTVRILDRRGKTVASSSGAGTVSVRAYVAAGSYSASVRNGTRSTIAFTVTGTTS